MVQKTCRSTIEAMTALTGISPQTVLHAIHARPVVSPATRKQMKEVIHELDDRPKALAVEALSRR